MHSSTNLFKEPSIEEGVFPYLHRTIDLKDFYLENNKWLTEDEIKIVKSYFDKHPNENRHKFNSKNGKSYNVIKLPTSVDTSTIDKPPTSSFWTSLKNLIFNTNSFFTQCTTNPALTNVNSLSQHEFYLIYDGAKKKKALGEGSFGKAKLLQDINAGKIFVEKIEKTVDLPMLKNEIEALRTHNKLLGYAKRWDKPHHLIAIPLEVGMTLTEFLRKYPIPPAHWLIIFKNLCQAVKELLAKGYLHCDLKPDNFFINPATLEISLIDFQFQQKVTDAKSPFGGGLGYLASEILLDKIKHHDKTKRTIPNSEKSEVNALGIIIGEALKITIESGEVGNLKCNEPIRFRISPNPKNFHQFEDSLFNDMVSLLNTMTDDDATKRPNFNEVESFFATHLSQLATNPEYALQSKKIGIINIDEYVNKSNPEQEDLNFTLSSMDEVWFIDNKKRSMHEYYKLTKCLEEYEFPIKIGTKLVKFPPTFSPEKAILQMSRPLANEKSGWPQCYFYVTCETKTAELQDSLSKQNIHLLFTKDTDRPNGYLNVIEDAQRKNFDYNKQLNTNSTQKLGT